MLGSKIQGEGSKNEEVLASVRPVALGLAALFCYLAIETLVLGGGSAYGGPLFVTAMTALAMATLVGSVARLKLPERWGHPLLFCLALLVFQSVTLVGYTITGRLGAAGIPLAILGAGMVMYSRRWLVATAAIGSLSTLLPLRPYSTADLQALASMLIATCVAILAIAHRSRVHKRLRTVHRDARERRSDLEASERRYALAMEGASDGLYDWDHQTNEVYYSARFKAILGQTNENFGTSPDEMLARIHPDDEERTQELLKKHFEGQDGHFECEFRILHEDGSYRLALVRGASIRDELGKAVRTAGSLTDLTGRGVFDALTGLPNRRLFLDRVKRAIEHSQRGHQDFALLFIDLDRFKLINDTLGHQAGDHVLVEVAARLQTCVRASDTVARLGGDEFVVILEQIELPDGAHISIQRILKRLSEPFPVKGRDFYVSASIGVVLDTRPYSDADSLIQDADTAMYQAKSHHAGWVVFDSSMRERSSARLQLESELRGALDRNEFTLEYQPFVSLDEGHIEGYEALVRWKHPTRGQVPPSEFIPILEETGMINRLGLWVLEEACREMQQKFPESDAHGHPCLSVNVSRKQLLDKSLIHQVQQTLEETGFEPKRLRLEITETAIVEQTDLAIATLVDIKDLGIEVMMDDFGTGHSSLGALGSLPIDTLKIDQSFIARLTSEVDGLEVVRTIIKMAQHMGIKVIAEGIETEEQLKLLQESECASGQGYLLARPAKLEATSSTDRETQPVTLPEGVTP
ncbi:MAG: EAL domain-containing protein [Longimicrobiales bacterium]